MILLTTFSATNIENQQRALKSWINLGYEIKSINSKNDIEKLKDIFNVEFIETDLIGIEFGKDYVKLNAFTNWIKENESALIINSDIEILKKIEITERNCEIELLTRNDYIYNYSEFRKFDSGYDAFYLTKQFCSEFPKTDLVVGQCHWDYLIPMVAMRLNYTLKSPNKSNLFHRKHELQYDVNKWKNTAKIFSKELNLTGNPHTDSAMSYKQIKRQIKYY